MIEKQCNIINLQHPLEEESSVQEGLDVVAVNCNLNSCDKENKGKSKP